MGYRGEVDEDLRNGVGYMCFPSQLAFPSCSSQLTEDFADWRDFQARPYDDQQVHLFPISHQALVEFRIEGLAKEGDIWLAISSPFDTPRACDTIRD